MMLYTKWTIMNLTDNGQTFINYLKKISLVVLQLITESYNHRQSYLVQLPSTFIWKPSFNFLACPSTHPEQVTNFPSFLHRYKIFLQIELSIVSQIKRYTGNDILYHELLLQVPLKSFSSWNKFWVVVKERCKRFRIQCSTKKGFLNCVSLRKLTAIQFIYQPYLSMGLKISKRVFFFSIYSTPFTALPRPTACPHTRTITSTYFL